MEKGSWQVLSQKLGSQWMYIVGRLIDPAQPLHGGNVEYAPDSHYTIDEAKAKKLAEALNKQTSDKRTSK